MTGTDSDFCSCSNHDEAHGANRYDVEVGKSVRGMTSPGGSMYWNATCWWREKRERERERDCNVWKILFFFLKRPKRHKGEFRWKSLEQHICRPTHNNRIRQDYTCTEWVTGISYKLLWLPFSCNRTQTVSLYKPKYITSINKAAYFKKTAKKRSNKRLPLLRQSSHTDWKSSMV